METAHLIIIGIIIIVLLLIYFKSQNKQEIKPQIQTKSPEENLDFLDKNYEANKIREIQYLTSQNNSNENDIKSTDLF